MSSPSGGGGVVVEWRLYGPTRGPGGLFQSLTDFAGNDTRLGEAYQAGLATVGEWYSENIARRFAEKHGRTGETAASIRGDFVGIAGDNGAEYAVSVGGHIGAVINPLPEHFILTGNKMALYNTQEGPWTGRTTNFPYMFGPSADVDWFQGGPDSYSPDRSWYEDAQADLAAEGQAMLQMLAPVVQQEWSLLTEGATEWSYGKAVIGQQG